MMTKNTPYQKETPETIQSMFGTIAHQYDKANSIMSFNLHKGWNRRLIQEVLQSRSISHYLDLCCGTGEIGLDLLHLLPHKCEAHFLDFCPEMLDCAKIKASQSDFERHDIYYHEADAQDLPLCTESIDCATVAYGIRNVKDPEKCFREVYRVLKPGGRFGILELTQPKNVFMKLGHKIYLSTALPIIGKCVATNQDAYKYLCNSIQAFTPPEEVKGKLEKIGFCDTKCISLMGGIATIIVGVKPR